MSVSLIPEVESFHANVKVGDSTVHVHAVTLDALLKTLGQIGHTSAAAAHAAAPATPKAEAPGKPAGTAAAPAASTPPAASSAQASTASPASAPADAAKQPDYNEIKAAVLAMSKINPAIAKSTLGQFKQMDGTPCDHGTKLQLPDYPAFLAAAKVALDAAKVPA